MAIDIQSNASSSLLANDNSLPSLSYDNMKPATTDDQPELCSSDCSSDDEVSKQPSSPRERRIAFGTIQIREFDLIVGDHPDVRVGPPIALGWKYETRPPTSIDEYEHGRDPYKRVLRLSSITRKNLLLNVYNVPESEIVNAEYEVQQIRRQRERSSTQSSARARLESGTSQIKRKLGRSILHGLANSVKFMSPTNIMVAVQA